MRRVVRRHLEVTISRRVVIATGLLLAPLIGVGTAIAFRPRPHVITVPSRAIASPKALDSLRRMSDSLVAVIAQESARFTGRAPLPFAVRIGQPSLVAFLPDSGDLNPEAAALRREFLATLPQAARVAAALQFRFYVRPSARLQLWGPDHAPMGGTAVNPEDVGYLLAAPRYPVVRLRGTYGDSALADALVRYAVLIGMPRHLRQSS